MPDGTIVQYAYTPIITTTGCGHNQAPARAGRNSDGRLGASKEAGPPTTAITTATVMPLPLGPISKNSAPSHPKIAGWSCSCGRASQHQGPLSDWPSVIPSPGLHIMVGDCVVAILTPMMDRIAPPVGPQSATSSLFQGTNLATSGCRKHSPYTHKGDRPQWTMRKTLRDRESANGTQPCQAQPQPRSTLLPTCMSMSRPSLSLPMRGCLARGSLPAEAELGRAMARGAARAAFAQRDAGSVKRVGAKSPGLRQVMETVEESNHHHEDGDTGDHFGKTLLPQRPQCSLQQPERENIRALAVMIFHMVLAMLERVTVGCWNVVRPVFDTDSDLHGRYRTGTSTCDDCILSLLALAFLFVVMLIGAWLIRGFVWLARGAAIVGRGYAFLAGV